MDDAIGGPAVEERLVGLKKALSLNQVSEVVVVEGTGRDQIERCGVAVPIASTGRAGEPTRAGKVGVDVAAIVYPRTKRCALSLTDCMRACKKIY